MLTRSHTESTSTPTAFSSANLLQLPPTPPPQAGPFDSVTIPLKLVRQDMHRLRQLEELRGKYTTGMLPDHELLKAVATICHSNGDRIRDTMPGR